MATDTTVVSRRAVLGGVLAGVGAAGAAVASPAAQAATTRKVVQRVAVRWSYNPRTGVTTVSRFAARTVRARFSGTTVALRNRAGTWVAIPYRWSARQKALVYDRRLHLRMLAAGAPAPKPPASPSPAPSPTATPRATPSPTPTPTPSPTQTQSPSPAPARTWSSVTPYLAADPARHLLNRCGYGPTAADLADIRRLGPDAWLDAQLRPDSLADARCQQLLTRLPDQSENIWHVRDLLNRDVRSSWDQQLSVLSGFTVRALWSKRQLLTVMEDFWGNHFNVTCPGDDVAESRAHYAHTIRRHALGSFADLLTAVTLHPAMLTYLNNRDSDDEHPNENHGRELLELHTVGLEAAYTESHVLDSARILTGLSVDWESGEYEFKPWRHWVGPVSVLGFQHANSSEVGGETVARAYLQHLAHHPATASRIATKLVRRFVSDDPPPALVGRLAATYLAEDTRIAPVLRELFASSEFASSIGAKSRRPFEQVVSVARLLGLQPDTEGVEGPEGLLWLAEDGGHNPFGAPFPTGWPDVTAAWASTTSVLQRWNATLSLSADWWPRAFDRPTLRALLIGPTLPTSHGELVDRVGTALFGAPVAAAHRSAALTFLGRAAGDVVRADSAAVTWRLPYLVGLLLDSPYHTLR